MADIAYMAGYLVGILIVFLVVWRLLHKKSFEKYVVKSFREE